MSLTALAKYKATFHLPFELYYDPGLAYTTKMQIPGYPSFAFFDRQGKMVAGLAGWQTEKQLWAAYQKAVKK